MLSFCKRILRRFWMSPRKLSQEAMDAATVSRLRASGVQIGVRCRIYSTEFSTEPYLVRLGDGVGVAGGVKFLTHDGAAHVVRSRRPMVQFLGRIVVGDNCFIGENAILLPGTTVGRDCVIGAGAVVRGTIPDNSLVIGNPGQIVGRASTFLYRVERGKNSLDTFGLPEPQRRSMILAHFGEPVDVGEGTAG
jgi:acetyltransferase-like isoleucine patch superfamily enzyme